MILKYFLSSFYLDFFFLLSKFRFRLIFLKDSRKSAANFFSLDYVGLLRNFTGMRIHFILSEEESRKDFALSD